MKTVINLSEDQRRFIMGLLDETQNEFREAFLELAKSGTGKDRRKFVAYRVALTELIVPKPLPVRVTEEKSGKQGKEVTL